MICGMNMTYYTINAQQIVFLKSSVPTYTITAFWAEGTYKGFEWKPLFRRTNK